VTSCPTRSGLDQLRGTHPRWGPCRLLYELGKAWVRPLPSRSTDFLNDAGPFATIEAAEAAVAGWHHEYNHDRPHQSLDMTTPASRFRPRPPDPDDALRSGTVTTLRSVSRMTATQVTVPGGCSMQRALVTTAAAIILTAVAVSTAGCGDSPAAGAPPTVHAPTSDRPAAAKEADVYVQVLRRYLSTPAENSFPGQAFKTVYVLNQAYPDAADPNGTHGRGTPIAPQAQHQVTAALAGIAHVIFIADRGSVIEARGGCGQVRDGGILITLGPPVSHGHEMQVAINGFVACLGATWLTYVLQDQPGAGWRVIGTTGSMAIA